MCAAERPCKPYLMAKILERKGRVTQLIGWKKLKTEKSVRSSLNYCTDKQFEKRETFLIDQQESIKTKIIVNILGYS